MSLAELLPSVKALPRAERLRLMQVMITDLAQEEGVSPLEASAVYSVWSPFAAEEAAQTLLHMLQAEGAKP
jgi:hypothetical protein